VPYHCKNRERRQAVAGVEKINGLDYLEVSADQTRLDVYFIHKLPGGAGGIPANPPLGRVNFAIEGGVRIRDIRIIDGPTAVGTTRKRLRLTVDQPGDFSTYRLRLVKDVGETVPPDDFDPQLAEIEFSFKVLCPSDFDCAPAGQCLPASGPLPAIDYLAKDYASFRRLLLDRLSLIAPDWRDRHAADVQMMLIEWLAYVGDHLSYFQDAVATEAYLGTARRRTSVRRHARALDYFLHDGANARCFVCFAVDETGPASVALAAATPIVTKTGHPRALMAPDVFATVVASGAGLVFETLHGAVLHRAHNRIRFYTWSDDDCCLRRGATAATLLNDPSLSLVPGDVLIFEEVRGTTTGLEADADPSRRHPVRLTTVTADTDPLTDIPVLRVSWHADDALPFAIRISAMIARDGATATRHEIAVARGNVVLADHGLRVTGTADEPGLTPAIVAATPAGLPERTRYRPRLSAEPLTFQAPIVRDESARAALHGDAHQALPVITLHGADGPWDARYDLLDSGPFATEFVVETEDDGSSWLRFGDDVHGRRPNAGEAFTAEYRVGNGRIGNVGADALAHVVGTGLNIARVRNPLPARGGEDPETLDHVREFAPQAFRTQERAVTERDYADVTERETASVQHAQATFRWTGSWHTAFVTVDRIGGLPVDAIFETALRGTLEPFRMAGYDLEINAPSFVSLDLRLTVCVQPHYFRADVKQALLLELGAGVLADGRRGLFHADNFSLGQPLYVSQVYDAAMRVAGVASVDVVKFQRWGKLPNQELANGVIRAARLEVLRLDNDPNFPEHGLLVLTMQGGL
jgi:hypothetical protein